MKKYILVLILCSVRLILIGQTGLELYLSTSHLPNSAKFNECIDLYNGSQEKGKNSDFQGIINDANKILELYNYDPHHMDDLNNNNTYGAFCDAYEMRGNAKYNLKDYLGAIADFEEYIRLKPNSYSNLGMWEHIGRAKMKLNDYEGALKYINYSIDRNPYQAGFGLYYRGVIKVFTYDFNGAISDFTYEIDKMELEKDCYAVEKYFLVRAYAKNLIGDKSGACEDIQTVMKLILRCPTRINLSTFLTDLPNYDDLLDVICNSEFTFSELAEANTPELIKDLIKQHNDKTQATNNPTPTSNSPAMDRFYNSQPITPIATNIEDFENKILGITDVNSKLSYMRMVTENTSDIDLKLHAMVTFHSTVIFGLDVNTDHIIYAKNESEKLIKIFMENGMSKAEKEVFNLESYVYILCQIKVDKNLNSFNQKIINLILSTYTADTYIDKKIYEELKRAKRANELEIWANNYIATLRANERKEESSPSYESNTNSKSTEASDCSDCKGTGKCQECTEKIQKPYLDDRCATNKRSSVNFGYVLCSGCYGYGYKRESGSKCDCPNGIGSCPGEKCPNSSCHDGWVYCRECNSGGNGDHLGECKECKGTGKEK